MKFLIIFSSFLSTLTFACAPDDLKCQNFCLEFDEEPTPILSMHTKSYYFNGPWRFDYTTKVTCELKANFLRRKYFRQGKLSKKSSYCQATVVFSPIEVQMIEESARRAFSEKIHSSPVSDESLYEYSLIINPKQPEELTISHFTKGMPFLHRNGPLSRFLSGKHFEICNYLSDVF